MFKTLLKKQLLELNQFYYINKRTGKHRSRSGTAGMTAVYVILFVFVSAVFYFLAFGIGSILIPFGFSRTYFSIFSVITMILGVIGSVFNTYTAMYKAKDNELLLSMPIPPGKILLVRMLGISVMSLLYTAIAWVPAVLYFWRHVPIGPAVILCPVVMYFVLTTAVIILTCLFGWVVAKISGKMKNRSVMTAALTMVFFFIYYFFSTKTSSMLTFLADNYEQVSESVAHYLHPFYRAGLAAAGGVPSLLLCAAVVIIAFFILYQIMSRTFIRMATLRDRVEKAAYNAQQKTKVNDVKQALVKKEGRRFLASSTYLLNCGLGVAFLPLITILAAVKRRELLDALQGMSTVMAISELIPAAATAVVCFIASMITFTAPSISLEGKNIWILQMLPVSPADVLNAKVRFHVLLSGIPSGICAVALGLILKVSIVQSILMAAVAVAFCFLTAAFGLILNLKSPNLTWTSEAVPVKQSAAVVIAMFGGMVMAAAPVLLRLALKWFNAEAFLVLVMVIYLLVYRGMQRWLNKKGAEIFSAL